MHLNDLVFAITIACEVGLGMLLLLTRVLLGFRAWPPPGRSSWQYGLVWTLTDIGFVGICLLGWLDWNSGPYLHGSRFAIGGMLIAAGMGFALWGIASLSWHTSLGLVGNLVTEGAYRYSRNPQYVGDTLLLIGFAIVCNSVLTAIAAGLGGSGSCSYHSPKNRGSKNNTGQPTSATSKPILDLSAGRPTRQRPVPTRYKLVTASQDHERNQSIRPSPSSRSRG